LSEATDSFAVSSSKLSHDALGDKVRGTITPAVAVALASAAAANAYVADLSGPNPFAGLSREQLSAITNDESGTFTTTERYAAYLPSGQ
jgi:hypothetical protein